MSGATTPGAGTNYERDINRDTGMDTSGASQPFVAGTPAGGMTGGRTTDQPMDRTTMAGPMGGSITSRETRAVAGANVGVVADPVPLGLATFAAGTFTVSTVLAGWFGPAGLVAAIPALIAVGGVAQFLAGMWCYGRGNLLGTVAFGSFGSFYFALGLLFLIGFPRILVGATSLSLTAGVFVLMFALIAAYLAFAALAENLMFAAVLGFLALAYLADGVGLFWVGGHNFITAIGGYAGLVSALLAFYLSAAIVVNTIRGRDALPSMSVRHEV
jgi:hypothetical protein